MKKFYLSVLLLANFLPLLAQVPTPGHPSQIGTISTLERSVILGSGREMAHETDQLGFTHERIQLTVAGYEVEGAVIRLITSPEGRIKQVGQIPESIPTNTTIALNFEEALQIAKSSIKTTHFAWELPYMENTLKYLENNPQATYFPKRNLVWLDSTFSTNGKRYRLAYKFDLFFVGVTDHKTVYVDAKTGEILLTLEACNHVSAKGQADTRYHGVREIITDSLGADSFVLFDNTRGGGIETLNIRNFKSVDSAVAFVDDDNHWDHDNAQMDNAGTGVHWGSEMTYDYFMKTHGRNSFDGKGTKILSYVHYDKGWFNASWNGKYARYGDGNNNPLTSIDVVAHELTHGVTGTSSGLIYRNESGALNESFSDIFGTAVEYYAVPEDANFEIGRENFLLREMGNTKRFRHPNCYGGVFWYTGTGDNGGVHINSGVQNYWFYLLCNGGEGTNDLGKNFKVDSIGMDKAAQIAYRNLVYYLTPSSTFADARVGAIEAAKDLFGPCSFEVEQVVKAWHAVGIGSNEDTKDLAITKLYDYESRCEMGEETVHVDYTFVESSCDSILPKGSELEFYFQIGSESPVKEVFTTKQDIKLFDTLSYTFGQRADLSNIARYQIRAWVKFKEDLIPANDSSNTIVVTHRAHPDKVDVIGFEPKDKEREDVLYHLTEEEYGRVAVTIPARKTGVRGLEFTGEPSGRIRDFVAPETEEDIFKTHRNQQAKMCMCVDARNWTDVNLSFDLRQTYSAIYYEYLKNYEPRLMTSLRVTVNGVQIDTIFHPDTVNQDPWVNHVMNLDQYSGTAFELCFEGKHFVSRTSFSSEHIGDNSFLDNINLYYTSLIPAPTGYNVVWGPNPTESFVRVQSYQDQPQVLEFKFTDALGRVVYETELQLDYGVNDKTLDISSLANGIYFMETSLKGETRLEKIVVH